MSGISRINWLYKQLFNAVRETMTFQKNDIEAVKIRRDAFISEHFDGRKYNELDEFELNEAIRAYKDNNLPVESITWSQEKHLKYLSMSVALRHADLSKLEIVIDGLKIKDNQEYVRAILLDKWGRKQKLDSGATAFLFESYINPLLNKYLREGDFRYSTNPNKLYFHQLTKDQASHLIKRLTEMIEQLKKRNSDEIMINHELN